MAQFIEFVGNHTFLFFTFMFVTGLLMWNLIEGQISGIQAVHPQEAIALINREDANRVYYRVSDARTLRLISMMREVFCSFCV